MMEPLLALWRTYVLRPLAYDREQWFSGASVRTRHYAGPPRWGRTGVSAGEWRWRWDLNPRWACTHTRSRGLGTGFHEVRAGRLRSDRRTAGPWHAPLHAGEL